MYYGYIALIAFDKSFWRSPSARGVTSLGIPIGMGVIVFTIPDYWASTCAAPTANSTTLTQKTSSKDVTK